MSFETVQISDLGFGDDGVSVAETTELLAWTLNSLNRKQNRLNCDFTGSRSKSRRSVTSWVRLFSKFL